MDGQSPLLEEIQGNIFPGFKRMHQTLLFLRITNASLCKRWVASLRPSITYARDILNSDGASAAWINIAFSYNAVKLLVGASVEFSDKAFTSGLAVRSSSLGDPTNPEAEGHPNNWVVGGTHNEADILLIIAHDDSRVLYEAVQGIEETIYATACGEKRLIRSGVQLIFKQSGAKLSNQQNSPEHFGFADGHSQPELRGFPGQQDRALDLVHPGEFLFGYLRQNPRNENDDSFPIANAGPRWAKNGSFLVFRRLRQDVAAFHKFLRNTAQMLVTEGRSGINEELLAAKIVGRWRSGVPLVSTPEHEEKSLVELNTFQFRGIDDQGLICPFASHIRKVNPRDDEVNAEQNLLDEKKSLRKSIVQTHRILRRGIPYGAPPEDLYRADSVDRGLLFLSYQTSIEGQFEFLIRNWLNNPDFKEQGSGYDPIIGQRSGDNRERFFRLIWKDEAGVPQSKDLIMEKDWVIPTGGGYFFVPPRSALDKFTEGRGNDAIGNVTIVSSSSSIRYFSRSHG